MSSPHSVRFAPWVVVLALFAGLVAAQPPEEEEPNPRKPVKVIDPDADDGVAVPDGMFYARLPAIVRAAANETKPQLKTFYTTFAVAFDRATDSRGKTARVTPVSFVFGKDRFPPTFPLYPLDDANKPGAGIEFTPAKLRKLEQFEKLAVAEVDKLLAPDPKSDLPAAAKLAAAELVLSEVLLYHDRAREQQKGRGPAWDPLKAAVNDKLTEVRVARIKQAAADRDWAKVRDLGTRLADRYRGDPKVLGPVAAARLAEADDLLKSDKPADLERVRELLNEFDARAPGSQDETAKRVRKAVQERAFKLFQDAERLATADPTQARNILRTVETLDPDLPGLREIQQTLKTGYSVLVVGARQLPERMSPATARFDSEKQAVELLFEGLYDAVPDDQLGVRYRPALAADRAGVAAGARDIVLARGDWAGPEKGGFDAADLAETVRLGRAKPDTWAADPLEWLDDPGQDATDPNRVRFRLRRGHPDPRSLLTFKILPGRWFAGKNKAADDVEFAKQPFGTGPFRLAPQKPAIPGGPPGTGDVIFVANPGYARRPGKIGQPAVKEVRFVDVTKLKDPVAEFRADRLHVLTDVPTKDLPKYSGQTGLGGKVRVVTAAANRRIHVLALNLRRPGLQSAELRRGLLHAVDRDAVLNEVFRAGSDEVHRPMAGPFPPLAWATPRPPGRPPAPLFDKDKALAGLKAYLREKNAPAAFGLAYPNDDPLARQACEKLKAQIEAVTATEDRKLTLTLDPVPPRELLRRVEDEHRFDLAYVPFEYPDDWFPLGLGSFLDPAAAGPGGRNFPGYLTKDANPTPDDHRLGDLLQQARTSRDVDGKLVPVAHDLHRQFNRTVPFVPLWQLDRHSVFATTVKVFLDGQTDEASPRLLNPTTLFTSIGRWRVE